MTRPESRAFFAAVLVVFSILAAGCGSAEPVADAVFLDGQVVTLGPVRDRRGGARCDYFGGGGDHHQQRLA